MPTNQHFSWPAGRASDPTGQAPLPASAEFVSTYNAQAHEIIEAIAAVVTNAQAGLNWLRAEPPDLEQVRRALDGIAGDGKRAADVIVRLRAFLKTTLQQTGESTLSR